MDIIIPIIAGIVCLVVGVVVGFQYRKSVAEKEIGSAETEATRIINEAIKAGETKKRESILEAKDEIHKQRTEADRELKERRNETQQLERRLIQREVVDRIANEMVRGNVLEGAAVTIDIDREGEYTCTVANKAFEGFDSPSFLEGTYEAPEE